MPAPVSVTAVLVAHDGSRWLPAVLSAVAAQTARPARLVAVDTGSADSSAAELRRAAGAVVELPSTTGYAAAVAAGLAAVPADTAWVWLLHDDSAPDPDVLEQLLRAAAARPDAAVLAPRAVDWDDPRLLVEVGLTTDAGGARDVGIEPGDLDQGQHTAPRDVLAAGTAGLLVRRDVWDALGGLDPALPLFRDDLDLGWRANAAGHAVVVVPAARIRHVRALTTGRRAPDAATGRVRRLDRRSALHVLLAHAAGWRLALALPRLALAAVLRTLGLLLLRSPRAAADEIGALLDVLAHPRRLHAARRARAATRTVPPSALRHLHSSAAVRLRSRVASALDRSGGARAVPALDDPATVPAPLVRRLLLRPDVRLAVALAVTALVAQRELLGPGALAGGRLLAAPEGASDLWTAYASSPDASPALVLLATLATALLGNAGLAVDALLLGSVPLAGLVAYAVAGQVVPSPLLRTWGAAVWALLPVATGAVAAGRLDAAVAHVALPALLVEGHRLVVRGGWQRACALGLALSAATAFAPVLWPLAGLLLLGTSLLRVRASGPAHRPAARARVVACAVTTLVPVVVLLPWSVSVLADPAALLHGPGRVTAGLAEAALPAWHLLLLSPGGPGLPAVGVTTGVLLAALGGLLATSRVRVAAAGWALALVGLGAALVLARTSAAGAPVWPGVALDVAAAGMLLAALVGGEGLQHRLAGASFGWRQLTAVAAVIAAAVVPAATAAAWLSRGADGPVTRTATSVLPAFARAELAAHADRSALLLTERADGTVTYVLAGADGPRLGRPGTAPTALGGVVGDLLAPRGTPAAAQAEAAGVRFVALDGGADLAAGLDASPGLLREPGQRPLWRVVPVPRPAPGPAAPGTARPVAGPAIQPTVLDEAGGDGGSTRPVLLALQALAVLVVAVLAGPGARPRHGLEPVARP